MNDSFKPCLGGRRGSLEVITPVAPASADGVEHPTRMGNETRPLANDARRVYRKAWRRYVAVLQDAIAAKPRSIAVASNINHRLKRALTSVAVPCGARSCACRANKRGGRADRTPTQAWSGLVSVRRAGLALLLVLATAFAGAPVARAVTFSDASGSPIVEHGEAGGVTVGDFNNDGH